MKGGENVADFEKVFNDNKGFVYKYLLKLSNSETLAEELTQETFFRAYMNISGLRDESKIPSWLCTIARNTYFAWYNEHKKHEDSEIIPELSDPEDTEKAFIEKDLAEDILKHLHNLEEPYKEVFMLSVLGQVSLKDISVIFGKSESWARVTFYRAKQKLIEKMR